MNGQLSSGIEMSPSLVAVFYPLHTIRCSGPVVFRSQLSRDIGCLLDVDDSVISWSCSPQVFAQGDETHHPDFLVETFDGGRIIDAAGVVAPPAWMANAAHILGHGYELISRRDLPPIRLKNAKDLLRYARYEVGLEDRVRLLAALDENGTMTLTDCLGAFRSIAPIPGMASLVLNRFVTMDLDQSLIGPETIVRRFPG